VLPAWKHVLRRRRIAGPAVLRHGREPDQAVLLQWHVLRNTMLRRPLVLPARAGLLRGPELLLS
jgi:hypothetical protein